MSLAKITESIEKVAMIMPGLASRVGRMATDKRVLKSVGTRAAVAGGVGAAGNVMLGDKNQGVIERATKGGLAGATIGAGYQAGKGIVKANKGLMNKASKPGAMSALPKKPVATAAKVQEATQSVAQRNFNASQGG